MDLGIRGRTALVAASSRGLGRAVADALAAEGAAVSLCGRDPEALARAEAELRAAGADVLANVADVTDPSAPARLVEATVARFGRLDIVVANAGGPPPMRALQADDDAMLAALQANLLSATRLVRASLGHLRAGGFGRICCISSYTVVQAAPPLALSSTARSGLWAWVKTAAADLAAERADITVNLACPGPHATDRMVQLGAPADLAMGDPADFGAAVAFLCSAQARFVNGAALVVDGGASLAL